MTEPKKRSDFSIKRFCPESPAHMSDVELDYGDVRDCVSQTPDPSPSTDPGAGSSGETSPRTPPSPSLPPNDLAAYYALHRNHPALRHGAYLIPAMLPGGLVAHPALTPPRDLVHPASSVPSTRTCTSVSRPTSTERAQDTSPVPTMTADDSHDGTSPPSPSSSDGGKGFKKPRKNYKNMTRERRVEANARERSRVHTISAAFESLRRAVPSYSYNQKLSKLAILRIACNYILALAKLADNSDYSEDNSDMSFADCVDLCTRTIQTEGRARRRH